MAQFVLVALTALVAVAGYWETEKFAREHGKNLLGFSSRRWAIACGVAGLVGAFLAPALVIGVLAGVVGYNEVRKLEATWREAPFGIPVLAWVVVFVVFGFAGAALTSAAVWLVVCGFAALAGAIFLGMEERDLLAHEKRVLLAENRRLLAHKSGLPSTGGAQPGVASS